MPIADLNDVILLQRSEPLRFGQSKPDVAGRIGPTADERRAFQTRKRINILRQQQQALIPGEIFRPSTETTCEPTDSTTLTLPFTGQGITEARR